MALKAPGGQGCAGFKEPTFLVAVRAQFPRAHHDRERCGREASVPRYQATPGHTARPLRLDTLKNVLAPGGPA